MAEEVVDQKEIIDQQCAESAKCQPAVHHLESCTKRVEDGSPENCVEEVFHMLHCINECGSKTLFSKLV